MNISDNGLSLLESMEGLVLHPYLDKAGIPTIGIGSTFYPGGRKVSLNDPACTKPQAYEYARNAIQIDFIPTIEKLVKVPLNQNQIDSLISFTYNEGSHALEESHLLNAINNNAGCESIKAEFMKWVYVSGKVDSWQIKRRTIESNVFCKSY